LLTDWVKMGAPYSEASTQATDRLHRRRSSAEDKSWWSFQPVKNVKAPEVKDKGWSRNPIDKFVFAKLQTEGLAPAPEADRRTLIRRAYFDLIGLPPSPEDVDRFIADKSPNAYERMIDGLLSNPHYGEKWARHWLDLVRFAESDGFKLDEFRPNAWRYRDYVIRSFNDDKPYGRFLMEQIAADELWPDDPDSLIGVSYLRLWIYEYNQRNVIGQWGTILNDLTDVTGDSLLGLGMQCARCHDHKFDPILQKDYFRLQAFFAPILPRDDVPLATAKQLKDYKEQLAKWEAATADLRAQIEAMEGPVKLKTEKAVIDKFPKDIQVISRKAPADRTPYEEQLADLAYRQVLVEFDKLDGKFKGVDKDKLDGLKKELAKFDDLKPKPLPDAMLVSDVGTTPPPVTIPKGKVPGPIEPGFLSMLNEAPAKISPVPTAPASTGRRTALAKWLAQPDNQFTTRVIVNRIWQRHFGNGLVRTPSDFGHLGEQPSHPELLDWLTTYFVAHNWSIKEMHKLIMMSAAYRQSALQSAPEVARLKDPDNRLLWRQNLRRLESDQIRDAMLWATGELDASIGGPSVDPSKARRTIYTKWLRNSRDPLLDAFDPPDAYTSTPQRNVTTTPTQALLMINGQYALQRAQVMAERIRKLKLSSDDELVTAVYRLIYDREPSAIEKKDGTFFLRDQVSRIAKSDKAAAQVDAEPMPRRPGTAAVFKTAGGQMRLQVPDNHQMPQYDLTAEAFIVLRSIDSAAAVRTIVSRWDGNKDQPGWSLDVTGKKSAYKAQTLALELIGDPAGDGVGGYEVIPSGIKIELDTPYYVAVSLRIGDTSESGATFYVKELTTGAATQTAHVPHKITSNHQSNLPIVIGARDPEKHHVWDGLIDDVRVSRAALRQDELLISKELMTENTVGFWCFETADFFKDSSPNGHNIKSEISPAAKVEPKTSALIDFCHVLLNSNEFLYVD